MSLDAWLSTARTSTDIADREKRTTCEQEPVTNPVLLSPVIASTPTDIADTEKAATREQDPIPGLLTPVAQTTTKPELHTPAAKDVFPRLFPSGSDDDEDDCENEKARWSCDTIRKKIAGFLATKEMTQTKFLQEIQCNSNSYGRFVKLKGTWNGTQNGVFWGAQRFFVKREAADKKRKAEEKAAQKHLPAADRKRKLEEAAGQMASKKSTLDELLAKIRAIDADVERHGIYDTCDEVRKKSLEFMAEYGMTQASFLREIGGIAGNSWNSFIKMKSAFKGHNPGAGNRSYTAAYYFLERARIVRGQPKSAKRIAAEADPDLQPDSMYGINARYTNGKGGYLLKNDDGKRWVIGRA